MTNENKPQAPLVDGYEVVIGIEIHCQLNTNTKIFSCESIITTNSASYISGTIYF